MPFQPFGEFNGVTRDQRLVTYRTVRSDNIFANQIVISGGTKGFIRSENFEDGVSGWALFGDGTAKLFTVALVSDLQGNWDGSDPANLATPDTGATTGYYFDASVGSSQHMGDMFVGGSMQIGNLTGATGTDYISISSGVIGWTILAASPLETPDEQAFFALGIDGDIMGVYPADTDLEWTLQSPSYTGVYAPWQRFSSHNYQFGSIEFGVGAYSDPAMWIGPNGVSIAYQERLMFPFSNDMFYMYVTGDHFDFVYEGNDGASSLVIWSVDETYLTLDMNRNIWLVSGSNTSPSLTFGTDTNTGLYLYGSDVLGVTVGGTTALTVAGTSGGFLTTEVVKANNEFQAGDGTYADPSFTFINAGATGMYLHNSTTLGWTAGSGGSRYMFLTDATSTSTAGTKGIGALQVLTWNDVELPSTSGVRIGAQSWGWDAGSNLVGLELEILRDATGSDWTTASVGFRRITDATSQASLWFYQSRVGINMSGPTKTLQAAGTFACRPRTGSGFDAHFINAGGSEYEISRVTSARKYKTDERDAPHLADIKLKPVSFLFQPEDGDEEVEYDPVREYGFIADDIAEQDELLGVYFDDEIENYSTRGVMAVLAAKINRLEAQVAMLLSN